MIHNSGFDFRAHEKFFHVQNGPMDTAEGINQDTGRNEAIRTSIFGIVPAITYNFKF